MIELDKGSPEAFADLLKRTLDQAASARMFSGEIVRIEPSGAHTRIAFNHPNVSAADVPNITPLQISGCDQDSFKAAVASSAVNALLAGALQQIDFRSDKFYPLLLKKGNEIALWYHGQRACNVKLRILGNLPELTKVGIWDEYKIDCLEGSIKAYQSGVGTQAFHTRLVTSRTFSTAISNLGPDITKSKIINAAFTLVAALSLSLNIPLMLDDVSVGNPVWEQAPDRPFSFFRRWGAFSQNPMDASTATFSANPSLSFDPLDIKTFEMRINTWFSIFAEKPALLPAFQKILKGLWEILSSSNEPEFAADQRAADGLLDCLVGMEGILIPIKDAPPTTRFIRLWKKLLTGLNAPLRSPRRSAEELYNLRSVLAHGNSVDLAQQLSATKKILGDSVNPSSYRPYDVGWQLQRTLGEAFERIGKDKDVLFSAIEAADWAPAPRNWYDFSRLIKLWRWL